MRALSGTLPPALEQVDRTWAWSRGRRLAYFGGCDYYRLSSHPAVLNALRTAAIPGSLNVAASRLTTGNHPVYAQLERALAAFFGFERALVVATGYLSNLVAAQGLRGGFTRVLVDERSHASPMDALRLFGCRATPFGHCDPRSLARALARLPEGGRPVVLSDGVFGRDGTVAPLAEYLPLLPDTGLLMVDDAHGAGVLGPHLRGAVEYCGLPRERVLLTVTLSKAFGVYGGALLGTAGLVERIARASAMFAGHTPPPPCLARAALAAIATLRADPALHLRLAANVRYVKTALSNAGVPTPDTPCPIVALTPGSAADAERLERRLLRQRVFPSLVRYPGGPPQGYFRFALSSEHDREQLDCLLEALAVPRPRARKR